MGRNGSGKTTLLRTVLGLHPPTSGRIELAGRDDGAARRRAGGDDRLPAAEPVVALLRRDPARRAGLHPEASPGTGAGIRGDPRRARAGACRGRNPRDLSGGERERAALATVLVGRPRLFLLDEPTRGMDDQRKRSLGELLRRLCAEGAATILATHDVELVAAVATRVILLGDGRIVADGGPRDVLSGSLTFATEINKLYGDGFLTPDDIVF